MFSIATFLINQYLHVPNKNTEISMQLFEILLIAILIIILFAKKIIVEKNGKKIIAFLLSTIVLGHLLFDGARWQMIPVYLSLVISSLYFFGNTSKKWLRFIMIFFSLLFLIFGGTLAYLLPVFGLPKPTGDFSVGTKDIYLKDTSRLETITDEPTDFRKITLKMYYPSEANLENPEKYLGNGIAEAFATSKGIPTFAFSHFDLISTHTEKNLPIKPTTFPLIILSHGYLWNAELYPSIIENLVSQGYIVAGIQHSYEAPIVHWKNEKIYPNQAYFNKMNEQMNHDKFGQLEVAFKEEENTEKRFVFMQEMMRMLPYNESIDRWQKDISFTIDALTKLNQNEKNEWFNKMDFDKIGVLGHSFGGAAAAEATVFDNRIKAGVNLDGAQWGKLIDTTLNTPFMAMYADRDYDVFNSPNFFIFEQTAKDDFYEVLIKNTGHANFGSLGHWTPLHQFTETGSINPNKMSEYTSTLLLAFFDKYLNGKTIDLKKLDLPKEKVLIKKLN
jgi:predicted dienelactone hydrolase